MIVVVVGTSLMPERAVESLFGALNDKVEHVAAYAGLMAWFGGMFRRSRQIGVAAVLVALGGALELLQALTPTRTPDLVDLTADTVGVLIGLALSMTVLTRWCQRIESLFPVR